MAKYIFKDQITPDGIVEHLKCSLESGYSIYSKKIGAAVHQIFVKKNAAIGCSLKCVAGDGVVTCHGPFACYSIGFALLSLFGVLLAFSIVVLFITGRFNVVIGGIIPVGLAAILVRLPSRDIVTRVGAIMRNIENGPEGVASTANDSTGIRHGEHATATEELGKIKSYVELFDREKYGINYTFLIAFIFSSIINISCGHFWLFGFGNMDLHPTSGLVNIIVSCIYGVLLLLLSHLVKRNWLLPFFWALITFVPQGLFFSGISVGIYTAAGGFALMAGLVLVIQLWGIRIWSLMIGLTGSGLFACYIPYGFYFHNASTITWFIVNVLVSVILQALILYAGFYLHLQKFNIRSISSSRQYTPQ